MRQDRKGFVEKLDFVTSLGHGEGGDHRARLGVATKGPSRLVTDLCIMEPEPRTREFIVTSIHPGVGRQAIVDSTGWAVRFADRVAETLPPTAAELAALHALQARTARAHETAA